MANIKATITSAGAKIVPQAVLINRIDKTGVGLSNTDNTSDANKPVSTAQQTALNLKADLNSPTFTGTVAIPNVANLETAVVANTAKLTTNTANVTAAGALMDSECTDLAAVKAFTGEAAATADQTDAEIRAAVEAATDSNVFTDADHTKLNAIEASATADQTDAEIRAAVEAASNSNVFTDADHTNLNAQSGTNTGDEVTATESVEGIVELATTSETTTGTDTTRATTPAGVQAAIDALVDSAPGALDTLNELAAALGDDANYATTITAALALKATKASPTFTGTVAIPNVANLETAVVANTAKLTNVSTNLSATANGTSLTVESSDGNNVALPAATTSAWGVMSDDQATKLDGIEASADVTDATNVTAAGALMDSECSNLAAVKAFTGEAGATADQTNAEIRTAVEAASDSNVFTDADHTKLNAISGTNTGDEATATESAEGIVELATSTEVESGWSSAAEKIVRSSHLRLKVEGGGIVLKGTTDPTSSGANTGIDSIISGNQNYSNSGLLLFGSNNHTTTLATAQLSGQYNNPNSGTTLRSLEEATTTTQAATV